MKPKCATCHIPNAGACPWKLSRIEDGAKVYTGKACGVGVCGKHGVEVKGKRLCPWHGLMASEMGLT